MRTRLSQWFDTATQQQLFGVLVFFNGKWCHFGVDGKEFVTNNPTIASEKREELRKIRQLFPAVNVVPKCIP